MKKEKIFILLLLCGTIGYLGFSSFNRIQRNKKVNAAIQSMPAFSFERHAGGQFTDANVQAKKLVISFFSPDCDHCQHMAGELVKKKETVSNTQLVMITTADSLAVDKFAKTYQLHQLSNLVLLRDTRYQFQTIFGARIIPSFFIYDENRKLVQKITGETKIENLLK